MSGDVEEKKSALIVKTLTVNSKRFTKATLAMLPVMSPDWYDQYKSGKLRVIGKIAKDVTVQILLNRGYRYFDTPSNVAMNPEKFLSGLIVHYDDQVFLTVLPSMEACSDFSPEIILLERSCALFDLDAEWDSSDEFEYLVDHADEVTKHGMNIKKKEYMESLRLKRIQASEDISKCELLKAAVGGAIDEIDSCYKYLFI